MDSLLLDVYQNNLLLQAKLLKNNVFYACVDDGNSTCTNIMQIIQIFLNVNNVSHSTYLHISYNNARKVPTGKKPHWSFHTHTHTQCSWRRVVIVNTARRQSCGRTSLSSSACVLAFSVDDKLSLVAVAFAFAPLYLACVATSSVIIPNTTRGKLRDSKQSGRTGTSRRSVAIDSSACCELA